MYDFSHHAINFISKTELSLYQHLDKDIPELRWTEGNLDKLVFIVLPNIKKICIILCTCSGLGFRLQQSFFERIHQPELSYQKSFYYYGLYSQLIHAHRIKYFKICFLLLRCTLVHVCVCLCSCRQRGWLARRLSYVLFVMERDVHKDMFTRNVVDNVLNSSG